MGDCGVQCGDDWEMVRPTQFLDVYRPRAVVRPTGPDKSDVRGTSIPCCLVVSGGRSVIQNLQIIGESPI